MVRSTLEDERNPRGFFEHFRGSLILMGAFFVAPPHSGHTRVHPEPFPVFVAGRPLTYSMGDGDITDSVRNTNLRITRARLPEPGKERYAISVRLIPRPPFPEPPLLHASPASRSAWSRRSRYRPGRPGTGGARPPG